MAPAKKLQVFVSSTYTDLREERQAAVEAILSSGHIPAGMELFTAGDESQMSVIRRWIDESDVFLLILGGRYGSLEPITGKSYTHLEYEYALERGKPLFAVVISDEALERRVRKGGRKNVEIENAKQLNEFREMVLSRMVRFWSDHRDIKLAIHETIGEFGRRPDLRGWVPGDQAVSGSFLAEEIARLTKENSELRSRVAASGGDQVKISGIAADELDQLLRQESVVLSDFSPEEIGELEEIAREFGDSEPSLVHILWKVHNWFMEQDVPVLTEITRSFRYYKRLEFYRLIELTHRTPGSHNFRITSDGRTFIFRLMRQFPQIVRTARRDEAGR